MISAYLQHHGILGMKWGIRRFEDKNGRLTAAGKERYKRSTKIGSLNKDKVKTHAKTIIGGLTIGAVVGSVINSGQKFVYKAILEKVLYADRKIDSLDSIPKITKKVSTEENMKHINPDFPSKGTTLNCTFCTSALVMREKGYDVKAMKTNMQWHGEAIFESVFNSKTEYPRALTLNRLERSIKKWGNNSYGNISVMWTTGGGHSMMWKNEKGTIMVYDGQDGTKTKLSELKGINPVLTEINRLDNCNPTQYILGIIERG